MVEKMRVADAKLESWPLAPEQIIAGQPETSGVSLHDGDDGTGTGIWECTPGSFEWSYDTHQSIYVLSGRAELEVEGGGRLRLEPGDAAFFPAGTKARWNVLETLRKVYTLYR